MKRIKCVVAYDGTDYSGFQTQPNQTTIQGEIESALTRITGEVINIFGSGRTDAGVHAQGQVFHFDTASTIPIDKWQFILNNQLPAAIVIRSAEEAAPDFHARFNAKAKEYRYCIDNGLVPDLIHHRYATHIRMPLDINRMQQAALLFTGEHDFTSFCSAKTYVEDKVRTIYDLQVKRDPPFIWISCCGNGFLYNMVRIIAGTLIEVGQGKREAEEITTMLAARDREAAGLTAPAGGLVLWKVTY